MKLGRYISYRHFLTNELELRQQKNPSYTVTDFCAELGIRHSRLTEILTGKMGISEGKAQQIADRLGLSVDDRQIFVDLVQSLHGRGTLVKKIALERLKQRFKAEAIEGTQGPLWNLASTDEIKKVGAHESSTIYFKLSEEQMPQFTQALKNLHKEFSTLAEEVDKKDFHFSAQIFKTSNSY